jgi:pilus assembly protein Flp/PilA
VARLRHFRPGALHERLSRSVQFGGGLVMLDRYFSRNVSRGQGLVEYALIIALVAVVVIGTLILLGPQIASIFRNISNNL